MQSGTLGLFDMTYTFGFADNVEGCGVNAHPDTIYSPQITLRLTGEVVEAPALPEPTTLALIGLGLAGIGAVRRKKLAG